MSFANDDMPLVSNILPVINRAGTIRRCIDSLLAQDYPNFEIIVQDAASTDGTLEILKSYGDKIQLFSEPDSGPEEGRCRAKKRAKGDIVSYCYSDEEFFPHTVSWAVAQFKKNPTAAMVYGDAYRTDQSGRIYDVVRSKEWDYKRYFCSEVTGPMCCMFFHNERCSSLSLKEYSDCGEYKVLINIGAKYPIIHIPEIIAKYGCGPDVSSYDIERSIKYHDAKVRAISRFLEQPYATQEIHALKSKAIAVTTLVLARMLWGQGHIDLAKRYIRKALRSKPDLMELRCNFLEHLMGLLSNKLVYIFGAGEHTKNILADLDLSAINCHVLGIIDGDENKWKSTLNGFAILSPKILQQSNYSVFISTFAGQEHIRADLKKKYKCNIIAPYNMEDHQNSWDFANLYFLKYFQI